MRAILFELLEKKAKHTSRYSTVITLKPFLSCTIKLLKYSRLDCAIVLLYYIMTHVIGATIKSQHFIIELTHSDPLAQYHPSRQEGCFAIALQFRQIKWLC